jgi:DNA-directed RNA polymerase subunit RPC12/RpoP
MTPFKCKMCGGDVEPNAGQAYGTCSHCGTIMTLPSATDEQKLAADQGHADARQLLRKL